MIMERGGGVHRGLSKTSGANSKTDLPFKKDQWRHWRERLGFVSGIFLLPKLDLNHFLQMG